MVDPSRQYSNGEITLEWRPELCLHCCNCINNLPQVFNLNRHPWINISGALTQEIIDTTKNCPDKALYVKIDRIQTW